MRTFFLLGIMAMGYFYLNGPPEIVPESSSKIVSERVDVADPCAVH